MEKLGRVLRQLRTERGVTQEKEGASIGMSQPQISLYEKNGMDSLSTLRCFAEFFNTNVTELLEMCERDDEQN